MRKRILIGALSIILLMPGLSATRGRQIVSTAGNAVRVGCTFTTDTAGDAYRLLTVRNLALLGVAYYLGVPCLNRARHFSNRVVEYGQECRYGIGSLSNLAARLLALPDRLRRWIDPYSRQEYAPANHTHPDLAAASHTHPDLAAASHTHRGLVTQQQLDAHKHPGFAQANHSHGGFATVKQHGQLDGKVTVLEGQVAGLLPALENK